MEKRENQSFELYATIILPVFNEIQCLEPELNRVHEAMRQSGRTYEVIVIDDASTDGSLAMAMRYAKEHSDRPTRVISLKRNRGSEHRAALEARPRVEKSS